MALKTWTDVLKIRSEVVATDGGVGDLQMSLHRAVYQTAKAPYQDVRYYGDITEPTPNLVGFFARVARRLSGANEPVALYHLDQGMGGGKSHALVGLYHMASNPGQFFETHVGKETLTEAEAGGTRISFEGARVVTLTADHFSPGKATETFGPAVNLFERFLWSLFEGDRARYDAAVAAGPNKATIQKALTNVGLPVLILLDELMDYAMALSSADSIANMPAEQAFLNALMDACDDVPRVAFVLVVIRTELDPEGYTPAAAGFREYLSARISRNGSTVAVTETGDFAAIIRRRIFEIAEYGSAALELADAFRRTVDGDPAWGSQVIDRMERGKNAIFADRIAGTYPFHPQLMDLVQNEWAKTQGFQRVRSTVSIFALAALHWGRAAQSGSWVPALIDVGDLPLGGINDSGRIPQARCLEALLNSGLLLGNDRAIQGYRAVATTDVASADTLTGRAVEIDRDLIAARIDAGQPTPAVRMSTALFNYSLVARSQGKRGATKPELMLALLTPANGGQSQFSAVEEVFTILTSAEGLGALEVNRPSNSQPERYWLTIKQTLRMFFNSARNQISEDRSLTLAWDTAQELATKGQFDNVHAVLKLDGGQDLSAVVGGFDSQENRLLILDPRQWTLLNGEDSTSRNDIRRMLGVGPDALLVDNGASCVVAAVNTYQRRYAVQAAQEYLTWKLVSEQVTESDEKDEVITKMTAAKETLRGAVRRAYRHYAYLTRKGDQLEAVFARFDEDQQTALNGNDVWSALVAANRAVGEYMDVAEKRRKRKPLSEEYVSMLLDGFNRHLTLRDVVSSFYKNPRFPLVPTLDEIRGVIYKLVQEPSHTGPGTGGWELVGSDGSVLSVEDAKQIAINSSQIQIRRRTEARSAVEGPRRDSTTETVTGTTGSPGVSTFDATRSQQSRPPETKRAESYSWYGIELTNRSITDAAKREEIRNLLRWLMSLLDKSDLDQQLISLRYELMAGTDSSLAEDMKLRGGSIEAKVYVREDS